LSTAGVSSYPETATAVSSQEGRRLETGEGAVPDARSWRTTQGRAAHPTPSELDEFVDAVASRLHLEADLRGIDR